MDRDRQTVFFFWYGWLASSVAPKKTLKTAKHILSMVRKRVMRRKKMVGSFRCWWRPTNYPFRANRMEWRGEMSWDQRSHTGWDWRLFASSHSSQKQEWFFLCLWCNSHLHNLNWEMGRTEDKNLTLCATLHTVRIFVKDCGGGKKDKRIGEWRFRCGSVVIGGEITFPLTALGESN